MLFTPNEAVNDVRLIYDEVVEIFDCIGKTFALDDLDITGDMTGMINCA